jgi:aminoglycoside/choline kinase family phosphotransferase
LEQGFLLLSDLGSTTYLQALTKDNAHNLYAEALGALICIQKASRPGVLPEYDRELLMRELELFPVWYVAATRASPSPTSRPPSSTRSSTASST